ncbi:MAG: glycosyltransferase family 2 protein [Clostridium sp.]
MKTLSLCVITRNNETTIERCLQSTKSIVSEIIIVDTGSTDKTLEICKKFNAKIYEFPWDNDFSKPKNLAISKATMDFILFLDSDEYLSKDAPLRIKNNINALDYKAYSLLIYSFKENGSCTHPLTRLFINDKGIYFEHRVHEQIDWSFTRKYPDITDYIYTDITIYHDGYNNKLFNQEEKFKRNTLILSSYTEEEKDEYYYFLIGRDQFFNKDYKNALSNLTKAYHSKSYKIERQQKYIFLLISASMYHLEMYNVCITSILNYLETAENFKDLYYILYLSYISISDISSSLKYLIKYKEIPVDNIRYPTIINYNHEIIEDTISRLRLAIYGKN